MGAGKVSRAELIPYQVRIMALQCALDSLIDVLCAGDPQLRAKVEAEVKRRSDALRERAEKMRETKP